MKNKLIISGVLVIMTLGIGVFWFSNLQWYSQNEILNTQNATTTNDQNPVIASKNISTWKSFDKIQPTFRYPSN